jgi:nitrite reductase/ring-hydroxylating ferredoxin subunit
VSTPSLDRQPAGSHSYPHDCWYLAARTDEIGRTLCPLHIAGQSLVLTRASDGTVAALADRGAHRPHPLSLGRLVDDRIVSGLDGWAYTLDGQCVHVPSQALIPVDARVRTYPTVDDGVFVWVWPGDPRLAERRRPPVLGWLRDDDWVGDGAERHPGPVRRARGGIPSLDRRPHAPTRGGGLRGIGVVRPPLSGRGSARLAPRRDRPARRGDVSSSGVRHPGLAGGVDRRLGGAERKLQVQPSFRAGRDSDRRSH